MSEPSLLQLRCRPVGDQLQDHAQRLASVAESPEGLTGELLALSGLLGRLADVLQEEEEMRPSPMRRFNSKWKPDPGGCHLWTAHQWPDGYGMFSYGRKSYRAHRWIFRRVHGFAPEVVMHQCDTPLCVRIDHLQAGTVAENNADRARKGRGANRQGELTPNAKFTAEEIRQIRRIYAAGGVSQRVLAEQFGTTQGNVSTIICRRTWSHV